MLAFFLSHFKLQIIFPIRSSNLHLFNHIHFKFFTNATCNIAACNVEISRLSRAGNVEAARKVFDEMPHRDVVSWNSIITAYWQNGFLQESKTLFHSMPSRNVVSWNSIISGCIQHDNADDAYEYFTSMPERNTASYNTMLSGFVRSRRIQEACRLFEIMPRRNVVSYTSMIDGYMQFGDVEQARSLFEIMPCRNVVSWTVMIRGYVDNGRFEEANELFRKMPEKNVIATTAMITGFCKEGRMEEARVLFDKLRFRDCVSYNAIISGYAKNGSSEKALKVHIQMLATGLQPDHATFISVLTACSNLASQSEGTQTHALVLKHGFSSHVSICNALISMYSRCGRIYDSVSAFGHVRSPNIVSWNTIIAAFAQHGLYEHALTYFKQMQLNGFEPDGLTFLSMFSACGHAGMVDESMKWFDLMESKYKVTPSSEHYACLVHMLGRAGQLEKAYLLIQQMPYEADSGVWGALLSACRANLNVELGQIAAEKFLKLEPDNSAAYVMLSNMYAARGMWKEVTYVRGLMKQHGVNKQPAYSWMDVGNEVHSFLGGDISHPSIEDIHTELKQINRQMEDKDRMHLALSQSYINEIDLYS
ncbi:hypothetical protein DCAR_0103681 [Daucus carota subsp. sativus]|uniref:Pentacotripeptide-repeat region of PRORP domain-containing protein n=1 Tax=Daucus carota subsp. sativus TaxID=79200 RepID=A0A166I704_DAUCS|nr:PREDICTED: pentatricopeptide repeat-containing protein At4g02750-like [Daucus carota subsp. sativus]WOG84497.1 hypothetical protein DCAR_0103681 [Daucus carota subsp. sativus]